MHVDNQKFKRVRSTFEGFFVLMNKNFLWIFTLQGGINEIVGGDINKRSKSFMICSFTVNYSSLVNLLSYFTRKPFDYIWVFIKVFQAVNF